MPKIKYVDKSFRDPSLKVIAQATVILDQLAEQGFNATLRQLYYQFVSRGWIENTQRSYKRLGSIINDARLTGLVDWSLMEDRTRNLESPSTWDDPADIVDAAAQSFRVDFWKAQDYRPEVWVEKDALVSVIAKACERYRVPYFSCRGYTSQSETWNAGRRLGRYIAECKKPYVIHLGDHDPSGIDMTRDIQDRLFMFAGGTVTVDRIALNMEQVEEYGPPPNPAKLTDSRIGGYLKLYGDKSWELDALDPPTLVEIIQAKLEKLVDRDRWNKTAERENEGRDALQKMADEYREGKS